MFLSRRLFNKQAYDKGSILKIHNIGKNWVVKFRRTMAYVLKNTVRRSRRVVNLTEFENGFTCYLAVRFERVGLESCTQETWIAPGELVHLAGFYFFFLACLIDQQLEVNRSQSFVSVVLDVVGPCLALDVDDDSTC